MDQDNSFGYSSFLSLSNHMVESILALELYCNKFLLAVELLEEYLNLKEPMRSDPKVNTK
ncbi:hypothetical protein QQP08_025167 [Theobroma cacao]|nr:hypothetical protein QQP08_025167 [Theobroma cacao]